MSPERVPPGQKVVPRLKRLDLGVVPSFDEEGWRLRIEGLVEKPVSLTYREVLDMPRFESTSDFHCVTGWTKLDNEWEGVAFRTIVGLSKPRPEARFVTFECGDGYTTSLALSELDGVDVLLAYGLDGGRLEARHGGPLRLIVPTKYAYKSAKWVQRIRFTADKELGFWEERGYSDQADPWTEDRYNH